MSTVNRRMFLGTAAAVAVPSAVATQPVASTEMLILCAEFRAAWSECERLWHVASDIVEENPIEGAKVQIGRFLRGRNDDGTDKFEPYWAYSFSSIESHYDQTLRSSLSIFGRENEDATRAKWAERVAAKKAELQEELDREQREEEECGLAQARRDASAAGDLADAFLGRIMAYQFASPADLRMAATCVHDYETAGMSGCYKQFVRTLAGLPPEVDE